MSARKEGGREGGEGGRGGDRKEEEGKGGKGSDESLLICLFMFPCLFTSMEKK